MHLGEAVIIVDDYMNNSPMITENMKVHRSGLSIHVSGETQFKEVPPELSLVVGDVIHNLRSSLDMMACEIVQAAGKSTKDVYFPFAASAEKLDHEIRRKNFDRAGDDAVQLLRSLAPYPSGNRDLRALHDLDIRDKHKALVEIYFSGSLLRLKLIDEAGNFFIDASSNNENISLIFAKGEPLAGREIIKALLDLTELTASIISKFEALS